MSYFNLQPSNENAPASREDLSNKRKSLASDSEETEEAELKVASSRRRRDPAKKTPYTDSIMSATLLREKYSSKLEW